MHVCEERPLYLVNNQRPNQMVRQFQEQVDDEYGELSLPVAKSAAPARK